MPMLIAIDPGHGGLDPGCAFAGLVEAHLTYQLALMLGGFEKRIIRLENEDPSFKERAFRARDCAAALVLHFNSGEVRFSKPEIYYAGPQAPAFWLDTVPTIATQGLQHGWSYPAILGKRVGMYDVTQYDRLNWPPDLAWLTRPQNCIEHYTIPVILLEVGYLSDPKVQEYIKDKGLAHIALTLSAWVAKRVEQTREQV